MLGMVKKKNRIETPSDNIFEKHAVGSIVKFELLDNGVPM